MPKILIMMLRCGIKVLNIWIRIDLFTQEMLSCKKNNKRNTYLLPWINSDFSSKQTEGISPISDINF